MNFSVRYNHVGYAPKGPKVFLLACNSAGNPLKGMLPWFDVIAENGERVYGASMVEKGTCTYTDEFVWEGNFSTVENPGKYRISIIDAKGNVLAESKFFEISDRLVLEQLSSALRSFYFQRSGVVLTPDRAGKWARPAAHLDDNIEFHPSMERKGTWNAHGGWYDAGDYGKYIVNGGVSVATLLLTAEFADDRRVTFENTDFFDAGSFRANLLEEIRFELEFFLRMQDDDGGVFFKVSPVRWEGFAGALGWLCFAVAVRCVAEAPDSREIDHLDTELCGSPRAGASRVCPCVSRVCKAVPGCCPPRLSLGNRES